jgi:capsular exopolysaccharide synthesis family protein
VDANRAAYATILKQLNEASISNDSPLSNIRITEQAERPGSPASSRASRILLLSAVMGVGLGAGLALVLENLNSTVRTAADVWRTVGAPTLGMVPHMKALREGRYGYGRLLSFSPARWLTSPIASMAQPFSQQLVVSHHPFSIASEFYRSTRTTLLLAEPEQPPRVILLTSANPGDGKTVTVLNLAITLAQSGRKVIVVDADLRKGNCHALLGLQNRSGLSNLLNEELGVEECLQETPVERLFLLSRGTPSPNPTDLLASNRMYEVLRALRERFDMVLVDSPPAIAISDAAILSSQCDGVVLVLRAQVTAVEAARRSVEGLEMVGARILGAVLNGIDIRNPDYADYRHYYKSYYAASVAKPEGRAK